MAEWGITDCPDEEELYIRQWNCAVVLRAKSIEHSDGSVHWEVQAGGDENWAEIALFKTYDEAIAFRDKLANFINDELEIHYYAGIEGRRRGFQSKQFSR